MTRWVLLAAALALAACERGSGGAANLHNVIQTRAPGHVAAGGHTSGEVLAASAQPQQAGDSGPAGTPGIPEGSGGNTGGAALVGGERGQQATTASPPPPVRSEKAGNAPPSTDVKTGASVNPPGVRSDAPAKAGN